MKPAVHQLVPRFEPGAVGSALLEGRAALRAAGYISEIFADEIDDRFVSLAAHETPDLEYDHARDAVLVYHLAIGATMADRLIARPERLIVSYHNLTPGELLEPWDPTLGPAIAWGRQQVRQLAPRTALAIAMSNYSAAELRATGYANVVTVPVLVDLAGHVVDNVRVDAICSSAPGSNWLYVSRIAPHKAQHDLIAAFALYRSVHDAQAQLWLCGGSASDRYLAALRGMVDALDLNDAVVFTGATSAAELAARYAAADVFVCLSDHEGFGVPLLEAWHHGLAVVAFDSSAVGETVGDAGLVLADKSAAVVAAAVARVVGDEPLRRLLVDRGRRRLARDFVPAEVRQSFVAAIESVL